MCLRVCMPCLDKHSVPCAKGPLHGLHVAGVGGLHGVEPQAFLAAQPALRLALRVDDEGPVGAVLDDQGVLCGRAVRRQAVGVPLADLNGLFDCLFIVEFIASKATVTIARPRRTI